MKNLYFLLFLFSVLFTNAQVTLTLQPDPCTGKDAFFYDNLPTQNCGSCNVIGTDRWTCGGIPCYGRSAIQFDLSTIPQGSTIVSATLSLYAHLTASSGSYGNPTFGTANASYLERVTTSWQEDSVNWNNQPSSDPTDRVLLPQSTSTTQDYPNIDIKNIVQYWAQNPAQNYGLLLDIITTNSLNSLFFYSSDFTDSTKRPKLVVTYLPPPQNACFTLQPDGCTGKDAFFYDNLPNQNCGSCNLIAADRWTCGGTPCHGASAIQFDLSSIPANAVINSATLSLYAHLTASSGSYGNPTFGNANASLLKRITAPWNESTVTWNTQPPVDTTNQVLLPQSTSNTQDYPNIDIRAFVQYWAQNPNQNYGMLLDIITTNSLNSLIFYSSDHTDPTKRPKLTVCYSVGGSTCTNNTLSLSLTSSNISCVHPQDTISVSVSGGTAPYSFVWNTGATTPSITTLQAGIYSVTVTDDSLCTKVGRDTVENLGMTVSLQSASHITCNGNSNGRVKVRVTGGVPPYTFLWSNGATTDSIGGLSVGSYTVTVTDALSCTASFTHVLYQMNTNWSYYVYITRTNSNCSNNGTATATAYGGTGPFTYLWSNGQTTQTATNLGPGTYFVTVTGSDGCIRTGSTTLTSSCRNVIQGFAFNDLNGNCVRDSGELAMSGVSVTATNGTNSYYGYSNSQGFYIIRISALGTFTVNASSSNYWGNCPTFTLCDSQTIVFPTLGDTSIVNFGFTNSSGFDLGINANWTAANPGFIKTYTLRPFQSSLPLYTDTATVVFQYDSILEFLTVLQNGVVDSAAHTITWRVTNIPYSWGSNFMQASFRVPVGTSINYQLRQEFFIYPFDGDCDTSDNHWFSVQPVVGSFDPNEKQVSPAGDIVEDDSVLTYTIHFQNTGNDTTWFVILKDTLSPHVNAATIQNLASSHPYTSFEITDNGIATWVFNPIFLVDSGTNEPASKGFVTFRVKKKSGLALSTEIENKASIYFDYNEPIVTNTVTNTLTEPSMIFEPRGDESISVSAAPNPFNQSTRITVQGLNGSFDFELFNVSGQGLQKLHSKQESFELYKEDLVPGIYFYRITALTGQSAFGKLVIQ